MRPKFVLILAIVVATLAAFAWFVDRDRPGSEERRRLADRLLSLEVDEVQRLSLSGQDGTVVLEKVAHDSEDDTDSADWALVEPIQARADASKVYALLTALSSLDVDRNLDDADPADYGLESPRWQLTIESDGGETTVAVGDELAGLNRVAVRVGGGGVDLVASHWLEQLSPDGTGWRSPQLFAHQRDDIERVRLMGAESNVTLARDGDEFRLIEPIQDRAHREHIEALLTAIVDLSAEEYLEGVAEEGATAVEVSLAGSEAWSVNLIGDGRVVVDGVAAQSDTAGLDEAVARAAEDWRSRDWSPVDGFEVDSAWIATAGGETRLEKADGDWTRDGEPIGFSAATGPLYALAEAGAESFLPLGSVESREPELTVELTAGEIVRELKLFAGDDGAECVGTIDDRDVALVLTEDSCDRVREGVATMRAAEPIGAPQAEDPEVQ